MILEVDTALLDKFSPLTINQLVFLNLLLSENQKINQDISNLISLIPDEDIADLNRRELITTTHTCDSISYDLTEKFKKQFNDNKDFFEEFYDQYPTVVIRPDGIKTYLRTNKVKCKKIYNQIIGKSKAMHEYMLKCLNYDVNNKVTTGKLCYMKNMWIWLTQHEWEQFDEYVKFESNSKDENKKIYGTGLI